MVSLALSKNLEGHDEGFARNSVDGSVGPSGPRFSTEIARQDLGKEHSCLPRLETVRGRK